MNAYPTFKFSLSNAASLLALTCLINCSPKPGSEEHIRQVTTSVTDAYLEKADEHPENWASYGRNYAEDRFSSLNQITKENVQRLGLAWSLDLETTRGIEATPLVMDGIMFISGPWSKVFAINVRTGKMLWTYDPKVSGAYAEKACCDVVNRGVALYQGRVYVGTLDGRLVSLDATTGKEVWSKLTIDSTKNYTITGAPRVVAGKVIIGNGGADYGVRGYITAYDAQTGEQKWRFYTVPGDPSQPFESKAMEMAAQTWSGDWWKYGGGGTAWDAMAYDPELKLLYVGTGNGSPWNWFHRSAGKGDNLFLSSIVALNPDNGELIWYYQTTPGDHWDYTATQQLILATITLEDESRKVIMQAPKNGFFYMLDRTNGKLLSAEPYTYINWAKSIDKNSGKPVETEFSRYEKENVEISPSPIGGHNWQPMAYNPVTKLVYIPVHFSTNTYGNNPDWKYSPRGWNIGTELNQKNQTRRDESSPANMNQGRLIAWDPVLQKEIWKVDHTATYWNGGVVATTDLVFQGNAEGKFTAYNSRNGKKLWESDLHSGIIGSPITYMVDGKQFVSIAVGWGGVIGLWNKYTKENYPGTLYTFALDHNQKYPDYYETEPKQMIKLPVAASPKEIADGKALYGVICDKCHGWPSDKGGAIPNLTYSTEGTFAIFNDIVLKGMYLQKGMPNFSGRLTEEDVNNIKSFILNSANELNKVVNE